MISRVFVVDDERLIASTTTAILKLNGYEAHWFVNPLEALEAARTVGPPDLVIADVIMPGLSGIDLAIRLKEERREKSKRLGNAKKEKTKRRHERVMHGKRKK